MRVSGKWQHLARPGARCSCVSLCCAVKEARSMRLIDSALLACAALLGTQTQRCAAVAVNISNIHYRMNTSGSVMDAHDGSYNRWTPDGPWYYYAMGYGTCKQGGDMCHGCG